MDREMARDALDPGGELGHPLVEWRRANQFAEFGHLLHGLGDREAVRRARRDQLGDPVGLAGRDLEDAGNVLDRGPRLHRSEGDDLAHAVAAVPFPDVFDHFAPALEAEVDVDIGHRHPFGVEEPFEQEVEPERIDVGDAEPVGHERSCRRAAAGPDRNAAIPGRLDEVLDDEEVAAVSRRGDDAEFVLEPFGHGGRERGAVPVLGATGGEVGEELIVVAVGFRPGEARDEVPFLEIELAEVRDPDGVVDRVGIFGEELPHLRLALDVRLLTGEPESLRIVEVSPGPDGEEHVVRLGVFPAEIVRVVGGHDREPEVLRQLDHAVEDHPLLVDTVILDFEPEPVGAEEPGEPLRGGLGLVVALGPETVGHLAREAGRQADDAFGVLFERLLVDPGAAIEALGVPDRRELDQVLISGLVFREQDQMAVVRRRLGGFLRAAAVAVGEVGLEAEDRPELAGLGRLIELPGPVHVAVIGERGTVHAEALEVAHQLGDLVRPVEQGVFAVGMEMDEAHRQATPGRPAGHPIYIGGPWGPAPDAEPGKGAKTITLSREEGSTPGARATDIAGGHWFG
ncbi:MAG: hypothetical protein R2882_12200 [Gemmatimonadales bacterium]